jgi:hypothetical protein
MRGRASVRASPLDTPSNAPSIARRFAVDMQRDAVE